MMAITLTVQVPQLDRLTKVLTRIGEQLMADFMGLTTSLESLRMDIAAEAAQVQVKLDELAAILTRDMSDQANVDAAAEAVEAMRPLVQEMVPDAPRP